MQISTGLHKAVSAAALLWGCLSAPLHGLALTVLTWAPGSVGAGAGLSDGTGPSFLKIFLEKVPETGDLRECMGPQSTGI